MWHKGLINKLKQNGNSCTLIEFLTNYLTDRKQRIVLNVFSPEYSPVESGVPQGSVLGPLLFLVYINDLEKNIKSRVKFYADDTMIFSVVQDLYISAADLNNDLKTISQWVQQWKMEFNPNPKKQTMEMLFSQKKISSVSSFSFFLCHQS